jgi:ATP-dependent RNA helicase RhlE
MTDSHAKKPITFKSLHLIDPILKSLEEEGYTIPTPIQEQSIPIVLGKNDLLASAQTGTGKTAAFAIPILQLLEQGTNKADKHIKIRCLVLTPTRELAVQIGDSFEAYGRHLEIYGTVVYGGVSQGRQTHALRRGVDVLIATPGRLLDLMNQGFVDLRSLEIFVLDEADRMLDMGFINDINKILKEVPKKRQTLFFSATMPAPIVKLADAMLHEPKFVEVKPAESTAERIVQTLYYVEKMKKQELLIHILQDEGIMSALVFTRTKHGADVVVKILERNRITAEAIHGNKAQNTRQRALDNFKAGRTRVLVATDIAARGIDVDHLEYVINFEIPNVAETYIHRIGRTGRAGASGVALSFCDQSEKAFIRDIEKLMGKKIHVMLEHPFTSKGAQVVKAGAAKAPEHKKKESSHKPKSEPRHEKKEKPYAPKPEREHRGEKRPNHVSRPESKESLEKKVERLLSPGEREWKSSKRAERREQAANPFDRKKKKHPSKSERQRRFEPRGPAEQAVPPSGANRFEKRTTEEPRPERAPQREFAKPFAPKGKKNRPNPYSGVPKGKGIKKRRGR